MVPERLYHMVLSVTGGLLLALMALGLSLQLGWRRELPGRRAARWPHHLLFFMVCAGAFLALGLGWRLGLAWWCLLPVLALLLGMTRTRPGRARHWQLALLCALAYVLGVWGAW